MRTSFHHQPEAQHPKSPAIETPAGRLPHLLMLWMAPPPARECHESGCCYRSSINIFAAVRRSRLALCVIRGAATFLVAIGVRADIGQRKRWIARSRMTRSGHGRGYLSRD